MWLVIALALYRHQSIPEVVAQLDLALPEAINPDIAKSALTQARQRLGRAPLAQLFGMSAACWDERHQAGRSWRGLARSPGSILSRRRRRAAATERVNSFSANYTSSILTALTRAFLSRRCRRLAGSPTPEPTR